MTKKPFGFLILHGFSGKPIGLQRISLPLGELGLPSLTPALRGHDEDNPEALIGIHWSEWVKDGEIALYQLLEEVEKVIVIGHSMGGWIALHLAIDHLEKIDSIIIAGATTRAVSLFGPAGPLNFLAPAIKLLQKRWEMPPVFVAPKYITYGNGYEWVPTKTWLNVFDFMKATEKRLPEVTHPILILHSKNDSMNSPRGVKIINEKISTPKDQKRIIWYEKTEHDMFNDCERDAIIRDVVDYVKERIAVKEYTYA
jgi:carboxylesterase